MEVRTILDDRLWEKFRNALKYVRCRILRSTRMTVEGILWHLRTGSPWRDLPRCFGKWEAVYSRFSEWSESGKLLKLFKELRRDPDFEWISIDSTSIKVHQHACGGGEDAKSVGTSRGGKNTKLHAVVDALGNPVHLELGPGNEHDSVKSPSLIGNSFGAENILADKAYDADELRKLIDDQHATAVIPLKKTVSNNLISTKTSTSLVIRSKISFKESRSFEELQLAT